MKINYKRIDNRITLFMLGYGIFLLRISVGIVFVWFGILKFFPNLSPAQDLATDTISILTFDLLNDNVSIIILAIWETLIGIGLITGKYLRVTLFLLFMQMLGTMTPLILFPAETFTKFPYAPTLLGQYIIKNLIIISAGLVIGSFVRRDIKLKKNIVLAN